MTRLTPALAGKLVQGTRGLYHHPQTGRVTGVFLIALDLTEGRIQVETLDRAYRHWVPIGRISIQDPGLERARALAFIQRAQTRRRTTS